MAHEDPVKQEQPILVSRSRKDVESHLESLVPLALDSLRSELLASLPDVFLEPTPTDGATFLSQNLRYVVRASDLKAVELIVLFAVSLGLVPAGAFVPSTIATLVVGTAMVAINARRYGCFLWDHELRVLLLLRKEPQSLADLVANLNDHDPQRTPYTEESVGEILKTLAARRTNNGEVRQFVVQAGDGRWSAADA